MEAEARTRDWAVPAAVVTAAFVLRAWSLGDQGLDHFDEGVYAISARALEDGGARAFPDQILFSPPLYLGLVGLVHRLLGVAVDMAAIWVNVLAGTLNVALVGWLGSRWFGRVAGWSSASLLALSELHVSLSRAGMTDTLFALTFTAALGLVVEALQGTRLRRAVFAGLAVGLAWNTKYHGWLSAAIVGLASLPYLMRAGEPARWRAATITLVVVTLTAMACYAPWAIYVQGHPGGYASLAEYQSGMLRPEWITNLIRQARFQLLMDGPLGRAAVPAAIGVAYALRGTGGLSVLGLALLSWFAGGPALLVVLAAIGVPFLLARRHGLAGWAVVCWLVVWLVLTPLYRPYVRLVMPGVVALCLAAGPALAAFAESSKPGARRGVLLAFPCAAAILFAGRGSAPTGDPYRASDGLRRAAAAILDEVPAGESIVVLGEPALVHYLRVGGREGAEHLVRRPGSSALEALAPLLETAEGAVWVVTGRYARSSGAEAGLRERYPGRVGTTFEHPLVPKDQRVYDDDDPWNIRHYREAPDGRYDIVLQRIAPAASSD